MGTEWQQPIVKEVVTKIANNIEKWMNHNEKEGYWNCAGFSVNIQHFAANVCVG